MSFASFFAPETSFLLRENSLDMSYIIRQVACARRYSSVTSNVGHRYSLYRITLHQSSHTAHTKKQIRKGKQAGSDLRYVTSRTHARTSARLRQLAPPAPAPALSLPPTPRAPLRRHAAACLRTPHRRRGASPPPAASHCRRRLPLASLLPSPPRRRRRRRRRRHRRRRHRRHRRLQEREEGEGCQLCALRWQLPLVWQAFAHAAVCTARSSRRRRGPAHACLQHARQRHITRSQQFTGHSTVSSCEALCGRQRDLDCA